MGEEDINNLGAVSDGRRRKSKKTCGRMDTSEETLAPIGGGWFCSEISYILRIKFKTMPIKWKKKLDQDTLTEWTHHITMGSVIIVLLVSLCDKAIHDHDTIQFLKSYGPYILSAIAIAVSIFSALQSHSKLTRKLTEAENFIVNSKESVRRATYANEVGSSHSEIKNNRNDNGEVAGASYELFNSIQLERSRNERIISQVTVNGNINLAVGILMTLLALGVLFTIFSIPDKSEITLNARLINYVPRIVLSVSIEIFSFFFLKLYRRNLDEIKYLQNERTNLEMKMIALNIALKRDDAASIQRAINELVKVERNFVLKKDETTIELKRHEQDGENVSDAIGKFADNMGKFAEVLKGKK